MYELKHKQAQKIVDKMMKDIPYNINIMDNRGVIIGSGNKERIGTLHKGAIEAIKQRKIVEIETDTQFEKRGINLPIEINNEIVGVVGISGEVKNTRPFGNLVKSTVILLIEQNVTLERKNREKSKKQEFFSLMINPNTEYTKELLNQALTYNINLTIPTQIMYIEFPYTFSEEISIMHYFPSFKISNHSLCSVIQESTNFVFLEKHIECHYTDTFISISKVNDTIAQGYRQSRSAMRVMKGLFPNKQRITYTSCEFIAGLSELLMDDKQSEHLAHLLEKHDELIKTLQVYISCNLNVNETAAGLIIHRNTLNYRLNKIQKITGKDPKNTLELIELIFMLINRKA